MTSAEDRGQSLPHRDQVLELIAAVAQGDAVGEDVTAALKDKGVDSLDTMVAILAEGAKQARKQVPLAQFAAAERAAAGAPREPSPPSVHRPGAMPFLLGGTLYDPADIERFQGQELHFIQSPAGDHTIVINDRSVIESWWQLSYLSANASSGSLIREPEPDGAGSAGVPSFDDDCDRHTYFFEHSNCIGEAIGLCANWGYYDLTELGLGIFGEAGDWNDVVSSVRQVGTHIAVLYEHVSWTGSTKTLFGGETRSLHPDWNDRASSLGTW